MLSRKLISASISGALFGILLGFIVPNPFGEKVVAAQNYFYSASTATFYYLIYSFPVILLYGVITSIVSDMVAVYLAEKFGNKKTEIIVSGVLHIIFGLVLLPFSLGASILFFITDKLIQKRSISFPALQVIKSFLIPLTIWVVSYGIFWMFG